jgi:hypothetical protein
MAYSNYQVTILREVSAEHGFSIIPLFKHFDKMLSIAQPAVIQLANFKF